MERYLTEAFQKLSLLEDDFNFTQNPDEDALRKFVDDDVEEVPEEDIIDVDAKTEEDLEDTYDGKVILECECCHSRIYKDIKDVIIDKETELANIEEECPVCNCTLGWTVIGKIEKFNPDDIPEETEEDEEESELDLRGAQEELADEDKPEEVEESLKENLTDFVDDDFSEEEVEEACDQLEEGWSPDVRGLEAFDAAGLSKLKEELDKAGIALDAENTCFYEYNHYRKAPVLLIYLDTDEYDSYLDKDVIEKAGRICDEFSSNVTVDDGEDFYIEVVCDPLEEKCNEACGKLEEARKKKGQPWDPKPIKLNKNDIDVLFSLTKAGEIDDPMDIPEFSLDDYSLGHHELEEDDELIEWNVSGMELIPDLDSGWDPNVVNGTTWLLHADVDTDDVDDYIGTLSHKDVQKLIKKSRGIDLPLFFDKFDFSILESCGKGSLQEDFKEVEIKTDDQKLEMTSDENGKVTVTTEPLEEEEILPPDDIDVEDVSVEGEEIVPLTDTNEEEIETNSEEAAEEETVEEQPEESEAPTEEETTEEETEETPEEEESEEVEEVEEESFNGVAESFMKRIYHNVNNFKTTAVKESGDTLMIEGLITFNSGASKKTTFKFKPELLNNKQVRLLGLNETFSNRKNSFNVRGNIVGKKLVFESMRYNYVAKNKLNESIQVKGREVNKKK